MAVAPAIQSALLRCIGTRPKEVFSSTDQECQLMADLAQEAAADISKAHDWRMLTKIHAFAGAEVVPFPDDYDRMVLGSEIDDPAAWFWGYHPFASVNDWMRFRSGNFQIISPGGWIILGGALNFWPVPSGQAQFPYVSSFWSRSEAGEAKGAFDADNDSFVLPERLLTLALVWRYKEATGLEYAEDMQNYETALAQEIGRDKGAYVLRTPQAHRAGSLAYTGRFIR